MAKKSVHLTAQSEQYIIERTMQGEEPNYSAHINAAFAQLINIAMDEAVNPSPEEFAELCNVYAGSDLTKIALPINLAADMLTHYGATVPGQLDKSTAVLINRLACMSQAKQFALIDKVRVFWAGGEDE